MRFANQNNRGLHAIGIMVLSSLFAISAYGGSTIYVDDDAALGGDGTSWDTAYKFLQDAITDAAGGGTSEIHVAQGTYKPDRDEDNPDGTGDREATFNLVNNVSLMGGYAGIGAKDPDARDIELFETILSGDLLGDDPPESDHHFDNCINVLTGSILDTSTVLDGFTVTHGSASTKDESDRIGAGLRLDGGIQVIRCTFEANFAYYKGGAIYAANGNLLLTECSFEFNFGSERAGAIYLENGTATLEACMFEGNFTSNDGSGAAISVSIVLLLQPTATSSRMKPVSKVEVSIPKIVPCAWLTVTSTPMMRMREAALLHFKARSLQRLVPSITPSLPMTMVVAFYSISAIRH